MVDLITTVRAFNAMAENGLIGLALTLPRIEAEGLYVEAGYDTFTDFCMYDLKKSKGFISKIMAAGKFALKNGYDQKMLDGATVTTIYQSLKAYPDKTPKFILSASKTNTLKELQDENHERKYPDHEHTPKDDTRYFICNCGKFTKI